MNETQPHTALERKFGYLPLEEQQRLDVKGGVRCYPESDGRFWIREETSLAGTTISTLRMMGDWANPIGIEVARLNEHVMARYSGLSTKLVDALNSAP